MLRENEIKQQLAFVLTESNFTFLAEPYIGKVRDSYVKGDLRYLVTSDRLSCFDVVLTSVPFKGQVLNFLAEHWFKLSSALVANHIVDIPDPNLMVVKNCQILPVEVVVRAYLSGSAWRDYQAGRDVSGVRLPPGMHAYQKLDEPILTPSIKAPKGEHDQPISEEQIVKSGLVPAPVWSQVRENALALFKLGSSKAAERGLILVDTKYEFGLLANKVILADEIHTLDSSRYWVESSYLERIGSNQAPEMLDKEPTRQWLLAQGYKGEGPIPNFSDEHRIQLARHYLDSALRITGKDVPVQVGEVQSRVEKVLRKLLNG